MKTNRIRPAQIDNSLTPPPTTMITRDIELSEAQAELLLQLNSDVALAQQKLNAAISMVLATNGIKQAELVRLTKHALTVRVIE